MSFDAAKYKNTVLLPLARDKSRLDALQQVIRDVQSDQGVRAVARLNMAELYAIEPGMNASQLAAHLKDLEKTYNSQKRASAQLLKRLILEVLPKAGADVAEPDFWAQAASSRDEALKEQIDAFARSIAAEYPLKVFTPEQVTDLASGMGLSSVPESSLRPALDREGVQIVHDFNVPALKIPIPIRKVTEFPDFRTLVDVLTRPEQPSGVSVIDVLSYGSPPRTFTPKSVKDAQILLQKQEARVDPVARQAAQNALGELSRLTTQGEIHALVLAALAESTKDLLRRQPSRLAVRDELVTWGIASLDAARLVTKFATTTKALGLSDVSDCLANGALAQARRTLDSLPSLEGDDVNERDRLAAAVDLAEKKKQRYISDYESALKGRDYVSAATALRAALGVDAQDETLRVALDRLPPLPPASVSLRVEGRTVDVLWSANVGDAVTYSVVRTRGEMPANHTDGHVVTTSSDATRVRDERPLIGVPTRYSVFATRDGASFSDPASATTIVLPAPTDVAVSCGVTDVSLTWSTPPEASGVIVTETSPDGTRREHRPQTPGQLTVSGLTTGTKYRFSVTALYVLPGGNRRESASSDIDATPRGSIRAVTDLRVDAVPGGHRAQWSSVVGYTVELWSLPIGASVPTGTRITADELARLGGERLTVRPTDAAGGITTREFDLLDDVSRLLPLTLDGDWGLAGNSEVAGAAPSVRNPVAERFGSEFRISWEWPAGDYVIEVAWRDGTGPRSLRTSRTSYNTDGGVRIPTAGLVGDVTLATVVRLGADEWVSSPVRVPVTGTEPLVSYELSVKRSAFGGKGSVAATVKSHDYRESATILTVLKESRFMPGAVSDGTIVDRRTIDFTSSSSTHFTLDLGKVATPFWVRLFAEPHSEVRIEDPPTTQMRG